MADRLTDYLACYRYGLIVTEHRSGGKDVDTDATSAPNSTQFSKASFAPTSRISVSLHMKHLRQQVFRAVFDRLDGRGIAGWDRTLLAWRARANNVALKAQEAASSSDWI
jgi:hypothetical protein